MRGTEPNRKDGYARDVGSMVGRMVMSMLKGMMSSYAG